MMAEFAALPLPVKLVWGVILLLNLLLLGMLWQRWQLYNDARTWPRLTLKADSVLPMRVVHTVSGNPMVNEHYEAIYTFHYRVNGREYTQQTTRMAGSEEAAQAMVKDMQLSFIYNPARPEETRAEPPGFATVWVTLLGWVLANGMLLGLLSHVSSFLAE